MADGEKDLIRAGGMWANKDRNGRTYLNGKLGGGVRVLIFPNNFRRNDNDPTHIMYFGQVEKQQDSGGDDLSGEPQDDLSDITDPWEGEEEVPQQAASANPAPSQQQPAQNAQRGTWNKTNGRR